jgi:hypothetical protein
METMTMTTATMTVTTPTSPLVGALKTARGRKAGVSIARADGRQIATTTDGDVWAVIDCPDDSTAAGDELHACAVPPAPAMGPATFACVLRWPQLEQIVDGVVPATDTESSRYALGGVQVECREGSMLAAIGTDGRRLHAAHVQPASIAGETPQYCVVPADAWRRLVSVSRAAVRAVRGVTGRKASEALRAGRVTIKTDGTVVILKWSHGGDLSVSTSTRLIEGRFPRWRDVVDPATAGGPGVVIDVDTMAAEVAEFSRRHRAAETAAKAAWAAAGVVAKAQRRYHAPFKHDRGVWIGPDGMEGRGAAFTNEVRSAAVRVCLDHTFVSDALAAVALFSPSGTAVVQATDAQSAVVFGKGAEAGEQIMVVMMPLAVDD